MRRGDITVMSVTAVLGAIAVGAVLFSLLVLDRESSAVVSRSGDSSWLVVTWGPGFCMAEPSSAPCTSGEVAHMGETMLLHGLWPQPKDNQYCGMTQAQAERVRREHTQLSQLELSHGVRDRLASTMVDADSLAPHEWYAHGSCSGVTPDVYFGDAVTLTTAVRETLDPVFRQSGGHQLTLSTIRERIDGVYGAGTGDRVALGCRNVTGKGAVVVDVRLSLPPVAALRAADDSYSISRLLAQAPPISTGCRQGLVP